MARLRFPRARAGPTSHEHRRGVDGLGTVHPQHERTPTPMMISDDGRKLAFDKRELVVLTGMMAKEDRPSYAALWFHGGRAQAWATDGHRAVMAEREIKPPRGNLSARPVAISAATAHHI